jgi:hypothetical protein
VELRNASLDAVKVKRKDFSELFDTKRANGDSEAVKETSSMFSVVFVDILQYSFVGLVQGLR